MDTEFSGKVAIVTGAARGIGRAIAVRFAQHGADVAIADLDLNGAAAFGEVIEAGSVEEEVRALGRRAIGVEGDLGKSEAADALIAQTMAAFGRIDILVNCAGGAIIDDQAGKASVASDDDIARVFAGNYNSMVYCTRAAIPHMRQQKSGAIINLSSVAGILAPPTGHLAHYGASKAAITSFTRSLAGELGPDGIRANVVAPGLIATARIVALSASRDVGTAEQIARIPLRRTGSAEDIAKAVHFFASDMASFVTGQCLAVTGGMPSIAC